MEKHLLQLNTVHLFRNNQVLDYKLTDMHNINSMQYKHLHT